MVNFNNELNLVSRISQTKNRNLQIKYFLSLVLIIFSISLLIALSGVKFSVAISLVLIVFFQILPGSLIWQWTNPNRNLILPELLGMGLALGTLLALLSAQSFRTYGFGDFGWSLPTIVSIVWLGLKRFGNVPKERRLHSSGFQKNEFLVLLFAVLVAIVQVSTWWRWHPLEWVGWWKYQIDVPYIESFSNSIAYLGTTESFMNPQQNSRYHWFAYGWIGAINRTFPVPPFTVQTRLFPIVAYACAILIIFAWGKRLSKSWWIPCIATLIMVLGPGTSIGSSVLLQSPASALTLGWALAFSLLLIAILKSEIPIRRGAPVLFFLAIGLVGGKVTTAIVIAFGLAALAISAMKKDSPNRSISLIASATGLFGIGLTYLLLIYSDVNRPITFGIFLGWPGLALSGLGACVGLLTHSYRKFGRLDQLSAFSISIFISGAIASLVTYDPSGNQIYFIIGAVGICIIPSLIMLEKQIEITGPLFKLWFSQLSKVSKMSIFISILTTGITAAILWSIFESTPGMTGDIGRTVTPLVAWLSSLLILFFVLILKNLNKSHALLFTLVMTLISTSISSVAGVTISAFNGPIYANADSRIRYGNSIQGAPGAFNQNYIEAGKWVKENIPIDGKFFTNRQCLDLRGTESVCDGLWFLASALTNRRFLVEGYGYSSGKFETNGEMSSNQVVSLRFAKNPTELDAVKLWEMGIRWGWIDHEVNNPKDWNGLAKIVFNNSDISIVELIPPRMME